MNAGSERTQNDDGVGWRVRLSHVVWFPLVVCAGTYGISFWGGGFERYDETTDKCVLLSRGMLVVWSGMRDYFPTVEYGRLIANRQSSPMPIPFRFSPSGSGNIAIPLFPLIALTSIPPLFGRFRSIQLRFWRHKSPGFPLLLGLVGFYGTVLRDLSEEGLFRSAWVLFMLVEAVGWLGAMITGTIWLLRLRRIIAESRRRASESPICTRCAYSLIGLISDRCPECGSIIPSCAAGDLSAGVAKRDTFAH